MNEEINELEKLILEVFFEVQCYPDDGAFNDECGLVIYDHLLGELKQLEKDKYRLDMLSRSFLRPHVIGLRNKQIIELTHGCMHDEDWQINGSGYLLTSKGVELCKKLFIKNENEYILPERTQS